MLHFGVFLCLTRLPRPRLHACFLTCHGVLARSPTASSIGGTASRRRWWRHRREGAAELPGASGRVVGVVECSATFLHCTVEFMYQRGPGESGASTEVELTTAGVRCSGERKDEQIENSRHALARSVKLWPHPTCRSSTPAQHTRQYVSIMITYHRCH